MHYILSRKLMWLILCVGSLGVTSVMAQETGADLKKYVSDEAISDLRGLLQKPVVLLSVNRQNDRHSKLSQAKIDMLDQQWRAERDAMDQPLIAPTLNNPLSTYLTQIQAGSGGLYTEIFVMDNKGLNVGQSAITSDFWQGDEAKFQKTFPLGPGAVFLDDAEFHEATKTWRVQLNMTLENEDGEAIGASTVELNLTELARRSR